MFPAIAVKFLRGEIKEEALEEPKEGPLISESAVPTEFLVEIEGEEFEVKVTPTGYTEIEKTGKKKKPDKALEGGIATSMQGIILKLNVKEGDEITQGDVVAVIEAMKMENEIVAPYSGKVEEIFVSKGDTVGSGDILMVVK